MAEQINDGGPAFPRPYSETKPGPYGRYYGGQEGMALRDWFAGQALAYAVVPYEPADKASSIARRAYEIAEAMIAQRKARHG